MQHFDGSIETERRSEAASCIFHIKRDTTSRPATARRSRRDAIAHEEEAPGGKVR
jgi:hypothetical protein